LGEKGSKEAIKKEKRSQFANTNNDNDDKRLHYAGLPSEVCWVKPYC
jgi:hypothetical protein